MATKIGSGVLEIDTRLGGWDRMTAGYLIEGTDPVLIETGSVGLVEPGSQRAAQPGKLREGGLAQRAVDECALARAAR